MEIIMQIIEESIRRLTISMVPGLDPIRVALEDIQPGKGRINIECFGKSWASFWGAMGNRTIADFFTDCNVSYLAGNLSDIQSDLTDGDAIVEGLRKELIKLRRSKDLDKDEARDLWLEIDEISAPCVEILYANHYELAVRLLGDDWWHQLPTKPNPDYEYLCRIIKTVQAALRAKVIL